MSDRELMLITGAASRTGIALGRRYAARNFHVLAIEDSDALADAAARRIGRDATPVVCDTSQAGEIDRLRDRIDGEWAEDLDTCILSDADRRRARQILRLADAVATTLVTRRRGRIVVATRAADRDLREGVAALRDRCDGTAILVAEVVGLPSSPPADWLLCADVDRVMRGRPPRAVRIRDGLRRPRDVASRLTATAVSSRRRRTSAATAR